MMTTSEVTDLTVFALNEIDKIGGKVGTVAILWCGEPDEDNRVATYKVLGKSSFDGSAVNGGSDDKP